MLITFSMSGSIISPGVFASLLWILIYFGNMSGLGRAFIMERERGTDTFLKLNFKSSTVFFGKLIFNMFLSVAVAVASYILLAGFVPPTIITSPWWLLALLLTGAVALSAGVTIVSAIVAVSGGKGGLLPILSLPIILPVLLLGIQAAEKAIVTSDTTSLLQDIGFMLSFAGAIISVSYIVFPILWED